MKVTAEGGAAPRGVVWRGDFRRLLCAVAVSHFGTQMSLVALPLVATVVLDAPPAQVALLTALETAGFLLIGLPAGAWVDRLRRLPLLVRADVVRCLALITIPAVVAVDVLTMPHLFAVAFITGLATVFFEVAHQSYVPGLVPRHHLSSANGVLETVRATGQIAGPGTGGAVTQLLGAPVAILFDAATYAISALFLRTIHKVEPRPAPAQGTSLWGEVKQGVAFVLGHRLLRAIAIATMMANFFSALLLSVQSVFLTRELGLSAGSVGVMLSAAAFGGLAGAVCAGRVARAVGQARAIWLSTAVTGPFALLWPLASVLGPPVVLFGIGSAVVAYGAVVYNVAQVSFRQLICPGDLLGRMNATLRFLVWGSMPLGAVAGSALAGTAGVTTAVWICAIGLLLVPLPLLWSPLRGLRDLPTHRSNTSAIDERGSL
ncbi:MFS transporter [Streptomyces sp. NPDC059076]|uniref:MFS transporter n=1 Tax=unclassified Streptomyces TaxID=2593676 RepID=UPI0036BFD0CF